MSSHRLYLNIHSQRLAGWLEGRVLSLEGTHPTFPSLPTWGAFSFVQGATTPGWACQFCSDTQHSAQQVPSGQQRMCSERPGSGDPPWMEPLGDYKTHDAPCWAVSKAGGPNPHSVSASLGFVIYVYMTEVPVSPRCTGTPGGCHAAWYPASLVTYFCAFVKMVC